MSSIRRHGKAVDVWFWRKGPQGQIKDTSENLLKHFLFIKSKDLSVDLRSQSIQKYLWMGCNTDLEAVVAKQENKKT